MRLFLIEFNNVTSQWLSNVCRVKKAACIHSHAIKDSIFLQCKYLSHRIELALHYLDTSEDGFYPEFLEKNRSVDGDRFVIHDLFQLTRAIIDIDAVEGVHNKVVHDFFKIFNVALSGVYIDGT